MAHILIVDDEEIARFTLREMLQAHGHTVVEAVNGVEGLHLAMTTPCDLVVTDIIMPDKEGIELIKDLRKAQPGRPIIAISGGGRTRNLDFLEIARQFGADAVLPKPFTTADLIKAITLLLPASAGVRP